jgi:hypothetical protein
VLGGHTESVRVGGYGDIASSVGVSVRVRVVQFQPGNDTVPVLVAYTAGLATRPVVTTAAAITPVSSLPPPVGIVNWTADVFSSFSALLHPAVNRTGLWGRTSALAVNSLRVSALAVLQAMLMDPRVVARVLVCEYNCMSFTHSHPPRSLITVVVLHP